MRVELQQLTKRLGSKEVLRGLDLMVPDNQVVCLVGGSGAGKTITLRHVIGLMKPDSGRVLVDGRDIVPLSETELIPVRRRFGMVFQNGGLLTSIPVGRNVSLALREHRLAPKADIPRIVSEKLALVGLAGIENQMPDSLSGGMRKRVSIARALTTGPEIILYDEPTAGLDPPLAAQIDGLILDLNKRLGVGALVVTHDMISVFRIADVVLMIHNGRIVEKGSPEEFKRSEVPEVVEFLQRDMGRL